LPANIALVTAALDLQLVRLIRAAIAPPVCRGPGSCLPTDRFEPRDVLQPTPRFEPRPVVSPTPRIEPRPVITPTPRVEVPPVQYGTTAPPDPGHPPRRLTLEPPWAVLPWEQPLPLSAPPAPVIKRVVYRTDTGGIGRRIDVLG
jgi:hypothetical protein